MNEIAEKGLAAHFKYKEGNDSEDRFDKWFGQIREVLNTQDGAGLDFLQDFKTSFLAEEIYVYTPKGEVKMLPTGSTALDFAFAIHSAVGSKCIGAKVQHKLVPLSHVLRSGDQIEIITSSKQKPSEDWLGFVVTAKAKNKIKDALREEKRTIAEDGKYVLQRKLESMGAAYSQHNLEELVHFYKLPSGLDLHYKIAIKYALAKCCNPIPGDDVFGFVSTGKGLIIHRTNCPNATQLLANFGHRVVKTKWAKNKEISFLTGLKIIGMDDVGVINKITNIISGDLRINIAGLTIESKEGLFEGTIKIFVHDKEELEVLVTRLKALNGIQTVDRFDAEAEN
jgi:GTP pyrophosphokinase